LLGEHPFQAVLGNRLEEGPPLALDVLAELNVRQRPQHIGQDFFTAAERQVLQVVAIQVKQIENLIDERTFVGLLIILHQLELGLAGFIEHDDLTIEHRLMAELRQRSDDRRVTFLEGKLFAGIETHSTLVYLRDGAIAVPLDFKEPIGVIERLGNRRGDRKSTRLNSSHLVISYAVFCLKKKKKKQQKRSRLQPASTRSNSLRYKQRSRNDREA